MTTRRIAKHEWVEGRLPPDPSGEPDGLIAVVDDGGLAYARDFAVLVAASDAPEAVKRRANFVCDGTDDQEEIQAAVDLAEENGGGVVLYSAGEFVAQGIDPGSDVIHVGQGWRSTTVRLPGGATEPLYQYDDGDEAWMTSFRFLRLVGDGKQGPGGIDFSSASRWWHAVVENCLIEGFSFGIHTSDGDRRPYISHTKMWDNERAIHIIGGSHPHVSNCDFRRNDHALFGNPVHMLVTSSSFVRNGSFATPDDGSFRECVFTGCDLASNYNGGVLGRGCVIDGGRLAALDDMEDYGDYAVTIDGVGCSLNGVHVQDDEQRFKCIVGSESDADGLSVSGFTARSAVKDFVRILQDISVLRSVTITGNSLRVEGKFARLVASNSARGCVISGNSVDARDSAIPADEGVIEIPSSLGAAAGDGGNVIEGNSITGPTQNGAFAFVGDLRASRFANHLQGIEVDPAAETDSRTVLDLGGVVPDVIDPQREVGPRINLQLGAAPTAPSYLLLFPTDDGNSGLVAGEIMGRVESSAGNVHRWGRIRVDAATREQDGTTNATISGERMDHPSAQDPRLVTLTWDSQEWLAVELRRGDLRSGFGAISWSGFLRVPDPDRLRLLADTDVSGVDEWETADNADSVSAF